MKKKNVYLILSATFGVLFLLLISLLKTVDVGVNPETNTEIGLYSLNKAVFNALGKNLVWKSITGVLGYVAFAVACAFVGLGVYQLVKGKSFKAVDKNIYALGVVYVCLAVLYVFFEKVVINYRPVILDAEKGAEASFPSSHTMLAVTIILSGLIEFNELVKNKTVKTAVFAVSVIYVVILVVGRLISGVHWFTDILGGVLISLCLVCAYGAFVNKTPRETVDDAQGE